MQRTLELSGFFVLPLPEHPSLPVAIRSHPDTLFYRIGDELFTYADFVENALPVLSDLREYHRDIRLHFVSETPGDKYPDDCALNVLNLSGRAYCRSDSASVTVREHLLAAGIPLRSVKQGYPACSVMALGDSSAITSDRGMARALSDDGVSVLLIEAGGISLPPHEYGFIGGASFVHRDTVYFFGDVRSHNDGERIINFINERGYKVISLSGEPLIDLGGALVFE